MESTTTNATLTCKCCGQVKPISEFRTYRGLPTGLCIACYTQSKRDNKAKKANELEESFKNKRLESFTVRDLINELVRRGYKGTLTYTEVHNIDITKF